MNKLHVNFFIIYRRAAAARRYRIVVSTLRCDRNSPSSNPGHGKCLRECMEQPTQQRSRVESIKLSFVKGKEREGSADDN